MKRREFLKRGLGAAVGAALAGGQSAVFAAEGKVRPRTLSAAAFGAVGDGKTDDGPAVQRLLDSAAQVTGPIQLQFAPGKTYFLATGRDRYAFLLKGVRNLTLDGGGSIFLIDARLRFLSLTDSRQVTVHNIKVEYSPLPFADGGIIAKNQAEGWVDVKIDTENPLPPLGGATQEDGEQAYFGLLWHEGPYSKPEDVYHVRNNFDVLDVREAYPGSLKERVVRVMTTPNSRLVGALEVNRWRLSVPVRGVAHRLGPGENCVVGGNQDVTFDSVDIWSAPWFAFGVHNNTGRVVFRKTHVRPRPGTGRLASSGRDGFHVKNNRASLLWDGCILQGMGDDAYNIATHASTVRAMNSSVRIEIQQNYPLGIAAMEAGDTLVAYQETRGILLGSATIAAVTTKEEGAITPPRAPVFAIELTTPILGLEAGKTLIWNRNSANPDTTLRRCRMDTSSRFRSPLTIESSHINALAWFTGDEIEAPIPSNIVVRDTTFRVGQGNPNLAVVIDGPNFQGRGPSEPVIFHILYDHNTIYGDFTLDDSADVHLLLNNFADPARSICMGNIRRVRLRGNTYGGKPLTDVGQIKTGNLEDAAEITVAR